MTDRRSDTDPPAARASNVDDEPGRPSKTPGARIAGRYIVERVLGRGGMATVYLAHDLLVDRPVAVKVLRRDLASSMAMDRFTREIGVVGRLRHAHIVPLHDSGVSDELPFYVMAYIDGETLQERVAREGPLPVVFAARVGTQMAEALAYAHREGVLHRDITPGNILLADGNAYLADFGIARMFGESARVRTTASGLVLGTPAYMSPEQASGELECDGRSDVYSLGCVLYEAIVGAPPFHGATTQAVIADRFRAPPAPVHEVRDDVPAELSDVIARAMRREPDERFADAAELGAALAAAAPPDATRIAPRRRRGGWRRTAALVLLVGAVLGALYVGCESANVVAPFY